MLRWLHELRRREEGQALVLACLSMLVLALCVLSTVNIARVAEQKMKLQDSADVVAYNMAADTARTFNFLAYSNRAMVLSHVTQMNIAGAVSYARYSAIAMLVVFKILAALTGQAWLEYIAFLWIAAALVLHYASLAVVPAIDALNALNMARQARRFGESVRDSGDGGKGEIVKTDPDFSSAQSLFGLLGGAAAFRLGTSVSVLPPKDHQRLTMAEIANAGRSEMTAFGKNNWSFPSVFPRRGSFSLLILKMEKSARTEWGMLSNMEQIYSIDLFRLTLNLLMFKLWFDLRSTIWFDRNMGGYETQPSVGTNCGSFPFFLKKACNAALKPFSMAIQMALGTGLRILNVVPRRVHSHLGMMMHGYLKLDADASKRFNQPINLSVASLLADKLEQKAQPFMREYGVQHGLSTGSSKLLQETNHTLAPPQRGWKTATDMRLARPPLLPRGLHAISVGMTYYHRPGDWREPPNLFNPFWGAKLAPVDETLSGVPGLSSIITQAVVH